MSINHFSSDIPQTPWWTQHHQPFLIENPSPKSPISTPQSFNYTPICPDSTQTHPSENFLKQPMFQKPLTPSDVGKLNRLVIPKQYAEKYFPLGAVSAESGEKGLLLSFEDESGKPWRFRYSYWSSSQSYVLTKGWSRFVKEKRLDAGDIVLFERHPADSERFFIGWRRRASAPPAQDIAVAQPDSGGGGWGRVLYNAQPFPSHPALGAPLTYQAEYLHAGSAVGNNNNNNERNENGKWSSNKRQVRLFGVNLECEELAAEESEVAEPIASDGSSFSSDGPPHYQYYYSSTNPHIHMVQDMKLAGGDVNQTRRYQ